MSDYLTPAQRSALRWLRERNGTGVYGKKGGVLMAGGEWAPFTRATWNALGELGYLERGLSLKRIVLTVKGWTCDVESAEQRPGIDRLGEMGEAR